MIKKSYQTLLLPDGTTFRGAFPTDKWFKAISVHIDWKGKTLLDLGCNHFSYGIYALHAGAKFVTGVDNNFELTEPVRWLLVGHGFEKSALFSCSDITGFPRGRYDIVLFSMILHWLEDPKDVIRVALDNCSQHVIFIYRLSHPTRAERGYRPTVKELTKFVGLPVVGSERLMDTEAQRIQMVIYGKDI